MRGSGSCPTHYDGQSENDVDVDPTTVTTKEPRTLFEVLAGNTRGRRTAISACGKTATATSTAVLPSPSCTASEDGKAPPRVPPGVAPTFLPEVLNGPRSLCQAATIPCSMGRWPEAGDMGAAEMWPGQPRLGHARTAFAWPADQTPGEIANDVEIRTGPGSERTPPR